MDTFSEVRDAIIHTVGSNFDSVEPESRLEDDLGLDSLDTVEMAVELEDRLNIDLGWDYTKWSTVKDVMQAVDEQLKGKKHG